MAVKIRLSRWGAKKRPYYRIVIANSDSPRDGKFIEKVGTYNPLLSNDDVNRVILKSERIEYWLSHGAQATERVAYFIASSGIQLPAAQKKKMEIKASNRKAKPTKKASA